MTLEKIKKGISQLYENYLSSFEPESKQYFDKHLKKSYSSITFTKEDIKINNEFQIKFDYLVQDYPFIIELLNYRSKINSFSEYIITSDLIINNFYKRLKKENTLYYIDSTNKTNATFSQNIVNNSRMNFYLNIDIIFYYIEKKYSSNLLINDTSEEIYVTKENNKNKLEHFIVKPLDRIINGLIKINFLNKEGKFIYNIKSHNYKHLAILTAKLEVSKCVILESNDYKNVNHQLYKNFFDKDFKYDNSTSIRRRIFDNDEDLGKYQKFYDSLSFLDNL